MARRYFVTVLAGDPHSLRKLGSHGMDLFQATSRETAEGNGAIEGLLTTDEIEQLIDGGYRVVVEEEASKRARATQTAEFEQWLRDLEV